MTPVAERTRAAHVTYDEGIAVAAPRVADDRIRCTREIWRERPAGGLADATVLTKPWLEVLRLFDHVSRPATGS